MRRVKRWWLNNWDFLLIWSALAVIGLLIGGMISATIAACQQVIAYH